MARVRVAAEIFVTGSKTKVFLKLPEVQKSEISAFLLLFSRLKLKKTLKFAFHIHFYLFIMIYIVIFYFLFLEEKK